MNIIYKPSGKAKEYSEYALNIAQGCIHGCKYCFAPGCFKITKESYHNKIVIKKNLLERVEKDLIYLNKHKQNPNVLLCFVTDPYQTDDIGDYTHKILELFNFYGINFNILTKAGARPEKDFYLYRKGDKFGVTLTFSNDKDSIDIEPMAGLPNDRISNLSKAYSLGIDTWVSFEPALDEKQIHALSMATKEFVNTYKVGKVSSYKSNISNWETFGNNMIELCSKYNKNYYIKKELLKCL